MRQLELTCRTLWIGILFFAIVCSPNWAAGAGKIKEVKWDADGQRILIPHTGSIGKHQTRVIAHPNRLVVDFEGTVLGKIPRKTRVQGSNVHEIRVGMYKGRARVVVDFQKNSVPTFKVVRSKGVVSLAFGKQPGTNSQLSRRKASEKALTKLSSTSPLSPKAVPAAGTSSGARMTGPSGASGSASRLPLVASARSDRSSAGSDGSRSSSFKGRVKGKAAGEHPSASSVKKPINLREVKLAQRLELNQPAPYRSGKSKRSVKEPRPAAPGAARAGKNLKMAQKLERGRPAPTTSQGTKARARTSIPDVKPSSTARLRGVPGRGRMVREVRPPVTPPTPDPRLVVQEVTELKFIQVGHNARLVIRGGDHLDYRMTRVSPTKVRLDLVNAEIPKAHQKPLKTDEFSTSVEMIVPGSQTIFIQLKDAVPYQVQKKKGVLMVDFPPPRFALTADQKAILVPKEGEAAPRAEYRARRESLMARREAARIMREEEFRRQSETIATQIAGLLKEQEEILKERRAIERKYRITGDPEVFSKPVTMNFQGISVQNVFRLLGEQAGLNIMLGDDVRGTVTMHLRDVPLGQVIDHILQSHGLDRDLVGNVMWVGRRARIQRTKNARMREYRTLLRQADQKLARNKREIRRLEKDREQALEKITKEEAVATELPTEAPVFETVGATETIEIDGEPVTLLLVQVKLNYAKVNDITPILECVFNRNCGGTTLPAGEAEAEALQTAQERLTSQGFQPGSPGAEARMERVRREIDRERRTQAAEEVARRTPAGEALAGLRGAGLSPRLQRILAHTIMWKNSKYNMLFIKDLPERIEEMKKLIATLDVPTPQVLIEARLVRANRNWARGLGINWGVNNNQITSRDIATITNPNPNRTYTMWGYTGLPGATAGSSPATDINPPYTSALTNTLWMDIPAANTLVGAAMQFGLLQGQLATDLDIRLAVGESNGKTKIIARPKVQVLDQQSATVLDGVQIPYPSVSADGTQVQFVSANIQLNVTPTIYPDGRIQMKLTVTDNEPGATFNGLTSIDNRQANTVLIVKDGDTAVIGGLLRRTTGRNNSGWPGLMYIPLVNFFFNANSKNEEIGELLLFVTPTILKKPPTAA
jgi:type IV pilus secretin PilQ/predicted competence protein